MKPLTPAQWVYLGAVLRAVALLLAIPFLVLLGFMYVALVLRLVLWGVRLVWLP